MTYRPADFRGRYLLIDFWAVWCGPCRAEMNHLHQAWEKYKDKGLALLSVSLDPRREDVAKYRSGKWPMPWLHAFADGGPANPAARAFEVIGIPKPVLVGPDGTIVAVEEELRRERLDGTLARVLGAEDPPGAKKE